MPLQLSVGLSKKQGLPDYGSIGASCSVTVELDGSLLQQDLESFHDHVKNAFVACSQAVNDELTRQTGESATHVHSNGHKPPSTSAGTGANKPANGNGSNGHHASQKQLDYCNQLARQIHGLGVRGLESLASKMFDKPLANLSSLEASSLIDTLKAIKEGRVDLETALNGATK